MRAGRRVASLSIALLAAAAARAQTPLGAAPATEPARPTAVYGAQLEGFDYSFPVRLFRLVEQGQSLDMAYMELRPAHPNGRTVVLLHGKAFCAAVLGDTARARIQPASRWR